MNNGIKVRNPQEFAATLYIIIPTKNPIKKASMIGDGLLFLATSRSSSSVN